MFQVHERKKFDFVETLLGFMYASLSFYHHGYEVAQDAQPWMTKLQTIVQRTRENYFKNMQSQTEELKRRMLDVKQVWKKMFETKKLRSFSFHLIK